MNVTDWDGIGNDLPTVAARETARRGRDLPEDLDRAIRSQGLTNEASLMWRQGLIDLRAADGRAVWRPVKVHA